MYRLSWCYLRAIYCSIMGLKSSDFDHLEEFSATTMQPTNQSVLSVDRVLKHLLQRLCRAALYRIVLISSGICLLYVIHQTTKHLPKLNVSSNNHNNNSLLNLRQKKEFAESRTTLKREKRLILLWNKPESVTIPFMKKEKCGDCDIIFDRQMAKESHAILIHYKNINELPDPKTRNAKQIYVWWCRESPWTTRNLYNLTIGRIFDNYFNATMTYRRDSDVFLPYAEVVHRNIDNGTSDYIPFLDSQVENMLAKKKYDVAWVVSNCYKTAGARARARFVFRLDQKGLKVDKFGKCYPLANFPAYRTAESFQRLSEYKFYLAFENAFHCRDYLTEKFWANSLYSGAVPIVWGAPKQDVERLAPRNSFIHVDDFASVGDLVKHIQDLSQNEEAYKKFFEWRFDMAKKKSKNVDEFNNWIFSRNQTFGFCELCRLLHSDRRNNHKTIPSMQEWWYSTENPDCLESFEESYQKLAN
ncbi:unnamed protein product [Clavelina lepadiformis]|uniref:Fucosyltransferase n=1 Tax=Clavelina lepadiformis TaxID=159417 RepID=A0ABP0F0Q7_CLALP